MIARRPSLDFGCVLDASILAKLVLPEEGSESATTLMAATATGDAPQRSVPGLVYLECANVLWRRVRRGELSADLADTKLAQLLALPLDSWPAERLVQQALSLAASLNVSVYDATYLALAQMLGVPLVTADLLLSRKGRAAGHDVRPLSEIGGDGGS